MSSLTLEVGPAKLQHLIPRPSHRPASQLLLGRSSLLSYSLFFARLPSIPRLEASRVYVDAVATQDKVPHNRDPCTASSSCAHKEVPDGPPSSTSCSRLPHSQYSTTSSVSFEAWGTSWGRRTWDRKSPTLLQSCPLIGMLCHSYQFPDTALHPKT